MLVMDASVSMQQGYLSIYLSIYLSKQIIWIEYVLIPKENLP